ncbi:hypothetical protein SAMN05421639_101819 [Chryseobacterium shigense]|uniref:Uncharacterized protein n=1 Tax=Chryseobacterium shigense TaxID=297244 RepID=A0A1N7HZW1_9FLAO|nr:hypothetical protein SAMN05421639_101819 [Chryseobacterium shigense]
MMKIAKVKNVKPSILEGFTFSILITYVMRRLYHH